jgi:hypothetical protein
LRHCCQMSLSNLVVPHFALLGFVKGREQVTLDIVII